MIDERHLLKWLRDYQFENYAEVGYEREYNFIDNLIKGIENEPKVEKCADCSRRKFYQQGYEAGKNENKWIPCSERLPETGTEVLVTLGYTYESDYTMHSIARYIHFDDGESHWCDNRYGYLEWDRYSDGRGGNSSYRVIAWMPLPRLYGE